MIYAQTTSQAVSLISEEKDIDPQIVKIVVDSYVGNIVKCLQHEVPFSITGFCKFYFTYHKARQSTMQAEYGKIFEGKVKTKLRMKVSIVAKKLLTFWVDDLNLKNNLPEELAKTAIQPDEIHKIRRRKLLQDQRSLGFRPDLLFDTENLHEADISVLNQLERSPTVQEITERIGVCDDD